MSKWFEQFDINHDGLIDFDEANEFLPKIEKRLKNSKENINNQLLEYFNMVDTNSDGQISFEEFSIVVRTKLNDFLNKRKDFKLI